MTPLTLTLLAMTLAAPPRYVPAADGSTAAVVVDGPLVHTGQLFGRDLPAVLDRLDAAITKAGGNPKQVAKLNVYAATVEAADAARVAVRDRYPADRRPAVSFVVGKLARPGATIAADAIAAGSGTPAKVALSSDAAVLPVGPRVYVSGQAEKGATPAEAARKTLESLKKTLAWLGCSTADVVQAKSFLTPITAADEVRKEFEAAFGKGKVPPLVFVDWQSALPIEIELIAAAPPQQSQHPGPIEFLTPPGMTASPVYAKVTRVHADKTIYVAGLYAPKPGTGEDEVTAVFDQLKGVLEKSGSDLRHLAKATYYVSSDDASKKLNDLRPRYYDPQRPPAASKAVVPGTGMRDRALTLDMIAVPASQK